LNPIVCIVLAVWLTAATGVNASDVGGDVLMSPDDGTPAAVESGALPAGAILRLGGLGSFGAPAPNSSVR
jgi:hypothetical protein